jgi:hypothetical protein
MMSAMRPRLYRATEGHWRQSSITIGKLVGRAVGAIPSSVQMGEACGGVLQPIRYVLKRFDRPGTCAAKRIKKPSAMLLRQTLMACH